MRDKSDRDRRWRNRTWTESERRALCNLRLIQFIPVASSKIGSPGDWRAIMPFEQLGGEMVPHLDLKSKAARSFMEEVGRRRDPEPHRQSLKTRSQTSCFCDWAALPEPLWSDVTWRVCMTMRYRHADAAPVTLLSENWRRRLDRKARRMRQSQPVENTSMQSLRNAVAETTQGESWDPGCQMIALEYLRARIDGTWNRDHFLQQAMSASELFDRIADDRKRYRLPVSTIPPEPTEEEFLSYLKSPEGSCREQVGRVMCRLLECEDLAQRDLGRAGLRTSRVFQWVAGRYVNALNVPRKIFTDMAIVYHILCVEDLALRCWTVFQAADILSGNDKDTFRAYLDWIRGFRALFVKPYLRAPESERSSQYWAALLRPFRAALEGDILLNSVFHSEVLREWTQQGRGGSRGGQPHTTEGLTIAYAVRQFSEHCPKPPRPRVQEVLADEPSYATPVLTAKHECEKGDVYAYVAPLMNALLRYRGYAFTVSSIRAFSNRYRNNARIKRFRGDLTLVHADTVEWTRRMLMLP